MKTQIMIDPHQSVLAKTAENGQLFEHERSCNETLVGESLVRQINRDIKTMDPVPSGMCGLTVRNIDENNIVQSEFSAFITIQSGEMRKW